MSAPSPSDHATPPRAAALTLPIGCLLAAGLCAAWAFAPLDEPAIDTAPAAPAPTAAADPRPLDLAAFSAPIWYVPPPPPEPPPAAEPRHLPPFGLELVAIVASDGRSEAVFYDPRADTLIHLHVGQTLADGRVVDAITTDAVRIREDAGVRTVALERPEP
jgi:hypothetical protein